MLLLAGSINPPCGVPPQVRPLNIPSLLQTVLLQQFKKLIVKACLSNNAYPLVLCALHQNNYNVGFIRLTPILLFSMKYFLHVLRSQKQVELFTNTQRYKVLDIPSTNNIYVYKQRIDRKEH